MTRITSFIVFHDLFFRAAVFGPPVETLVDVLVLDDVFLGDGSGD